MRGHLRIMSIYDTVDAQKLTSNVHAADPRDSLGPVQAFQLENGLKIVQHS